MKDVHRWPANGREQAPDDWQRSHRLRPGGSSGLARSPGHPAVSSNRAGGQSSGGTGKIRGSPE